MKKLALISLVLLAITPAAFANPIGPSVPAGSWHVLWNDNNMGGDIDLVAYRITSDGGAGLFEAPGLRDIPQARWVVLPTAAGNALAQGIPTSLLGDYNLWFQGKDNLTLEMDEAIFTTASGNQPARVQHYWYNLGTPSGTEQVYGAWAWTDHGTWDVTRDQALGLAVPVPAAALLGALGLGLVGWTKKRLA